MTPENHEYTVAETLAHGQRSLNLLDEINKTIDQEPYAIAWSQESDLINFIGKVMIEVTVEGSYSPESTHRPGSWRKETVENQVQHAARHVIDAPLGLVQGKPIYSVLDLRHALWRIGAALYLLEYGREPNGEDDTRTDGGDQPELP